VNLFKVAANVRGFAKVGYSVFLSLAWPYLLFTYGQITEVD